MDDKLNGIMQRIERKTYLVNPPIHKIEIDPSDFNWMIQTIEQQQEKLSRMYYENYQQTESLVDMNNEIERLKEELEQTLEEFEEEMIFLKGE